MTVTFRRLNKRRGAFQSEEDDFVDLFFLLEPVNAALQVRGEEAIVPGLQLRQLPIVAGDLPPTEIGAAAAGELIVGGAVAHGVINAHLFTWLDVAQGNEGNRTGQAQIGGAGVVDIIPRIWFAHIGHLIQIVFYLYTVLLLEGIEAGKLCLGDDIATPANNQLALRNCFQGKEPVISLGWILTNFQLG